MLIIVESPAKAKTIAHIVGPEYTVTASVGHIRGLSDDKKTKAGKTLEINGIDIEDNFQPYYQTDPKKADIVAKLKQLVKTNPVVLFATDADREGEAISWHLAEVLGFKDKSKIKRLEFHEITPKAIKEALANPRHLNQELVAAQQARQVLDKLVGYKLSPVLWNTMGNYHLSAGRVQSPALHLVCVRENEIEAFVIEEYWEIEGDFENSGSNQNSKSGNSPALLDLRLLDSTKEITEKANQTWKLTKIAGQKIPNPISSQKEVEELLSKTLNDTEFKVEKITPKDEKSSPRAPFTTSTLQQAASTKLGFSPRQTMQTAQKLYEGVEISGKFTALITYMRTDSTNLSADSIEVARTWIKNTHPKALPASPRIYKSKSRNAQEAHEAIRPINPALHPDSLKGKIDSGLYRLYNLIWQQMVASQMTDEIRQRYVMDLVNSNQDVFAGSIAWTISPGFKLVTGEDFTLTPKELLKEGQSLFLNSIIAFQKQTRPPSRFSPASLIKHMEEAGIGRPSTYATIISTLQDREYVVIEGSSMKPTPLGRKIDQLLFANFKEVTSSELTAEMEESLDEISRGEKQYAQVLSDFWFPFKKQVEEKSLQIKEQKDDYRSSQTDVLCPTCNAATVLKIGRFGEYFQCQEHQEHQFPKNFREYNIALEEAREKYNYQLKDRVCEVCAKPLIVRVSKASLKTYLACAEYKVGNNHTVAPISLGDCPRCALAGRTGSKAGVLVMKRGFRGKSFLGCSLPAEVCGFIEGQDPAEVAKPKKAVTKTATAKPNFTKKAPAKKATAKTKKIT